MDDALVSLRRPVSLAAVRGTPGLFEFRRMCLLFFDFFGGSLLQKRGRPPRPREEAHAGGDFEDEGEAEGLAHPQSKRKRAASATAAAALDQPLIG
jgi:hypothetical protein